MSDREKLIEIIGNTQYGNGSYVGKNFQRGFIEKIADHLISNGVTVQSRFQSPFENDIFALIWNAFKNLYPNKECQCFWQPNIRPEEDGTEVYGLTDFGDDGIVTVFVTPELAIQDAAEIFAHELAHVAVGVEAGHGKKWRGAFDKIFEEYNRIGDELFDRHDAVTVTDGKAYVREPPKECE